MADFVLVPGAWLGAWAWDEVVPRLRTAGHGVHPVTLTGLVGEDDGRADGEHDAVGLETHVQDVVRAVEDRGLKEAVLVGHSYSGIPVAMAAERIGARLARLVLVDAEIPVEGRSFANSLWDGGGMAAAAIRHNGGFWAPLIAEDFEGQGLSQQQVERIVAGSVPHPGASLTEPASLARSLSELPATYVKCLLDGPEPRTEVAELLQGERWDLVEMHTGHWPMFSRPQELARVLMETTGARS
ncbi:alpha/beta fold hydrolase [Streptomonospora litoralis]|nr:alpha/beta hydrolase [Streptomonospora litoralis]